MSWLCRKYHVILRLNISSFEHLSKYKMLSHLSMTCFSLEACIPPLHQSLKHILIFKQLNHARQQFGQKGILTCPPIPTKVYFRKQGQDSPVTAFPQQNILMCPSSPMNMNLLQMHMYTQLRTMMDPGNTLHNIRKKNVLRYRQHYPISINSAAHHCRDTFWVDSQGWRYCYPSDYNSSQILLG